MNNFTEYLDTLTDNGQRSRLEQIFSWISETFPQLQRRIAWNQPMFTDHGTFIIGFSTAKNHISVSNEKAGLEEFLERIKDAGYSHGKLLWKIENTQEVNYELLKEMITYNIEEKRDCTTFWRK